MNILYVTSEAAPFCKTGGLADVAGSLPQALVKTGRRAVIALAQKALGDRLKDVAMN